MLGGGGEEVIAMPVVYPRGMVSVSSLSSFLSVGSSSEPYHPSLPLSLSEYTVLKGISRRRGGGSKNKSSHRRRRTSAGSR